MSYRIGPASNSGITVRNGRRNHCVMLYPVTNRMDEWMCNFTSFSTEFQSQQDGRRVPVKDWDPHNGRKYLRLQQDTTPGPLAQKALLTVKITVLKTRAKLFKASLA